MAEKSTDALTDEEKRGYYKIGWLERIAFGSGDLAQNFVWITIGAYLMVFYTDVFRVDAAVVGTIFLLSRLVNAVWDPIIGTIVDKFSFSFGRYRGWMTISAIPFAIATLLCFWMPFHNDDKFDVGKIIYISVTYVFLSMIYTTVNVPYGALGASITRDPKEVVILATTRTYFANIGRLVVSYGVPVLIMTLSGSQKWSEPENAGSVFVTMAIIAALGLAVLFFSIKGTKERVTITKEAAEKVKISDVIVALRENAPLRVLCAIFFLNQFIATVPGSAGAYYMKYNVGQQELAPIFSAISPIPPLLILPFIPFLRKKFGKQAVLYIALCIGIVGYAGLFLAPASEPMLIFAAQFVRASGMVVFGSFIWSLLPEVITYGEWKTGKRVSGIVSSMVGFFFTFATTVAAAIPGYILSAAGFDPNLGVTGQPDSALLAIKILLAGLPILFVVIVIVLVTRFKLTDDELEQMSKEIEEREKAELAQA